MTDVDTTEAKEPGGVGSTEQPKRAGAGSAGAGAQQSAAAPSPFPPIADYAFLSNCHTGALVAADGARTADRTPRRSRGADCRRSTPPSRITPIPSRMGPTATTTTRTSEGCAALRGTPQNTDI